MRLIKNFLLSALVTIGAFGIVTYTSCTKDECKGVSCNNGGTCVSGTCSCPLGYEGTTCQTESRAKFSKNWNVNETPTISNPYTCLIASGSTITSVTISNTFANNFFTNPLSATISSNMLTIPLQKPDAGGDYNVQGTLTYSVNSLSSSYTITKISTGATVVVNGTWQ